ncbi:unnamed protein product [Moneuplotes crassus]|uniref:Uncharacterized protein n=1 Tax=Euplotes crassus TaxID=5936 RepID=A0AAD1UF69_EUPCR|nr:unnamed protein product [Moneuplotes crassus]
MGKNYEHDPQRRRVQNEIHQELRIKKRLLNKGRVPFVFQSSSPPKKTTVELSKNKSCEFSFNFERNTTNNSQEKLFIEEHCAHKEYDYAKDKLINLKNENSRFLKVLKAFIKKPLKIHKRSGYIPFPRVKSRLSPIKSRNSSFLTKNPKPTINPEHTHKTVIPPKEINHNYTRQIMKFIEFYERSPKDSKKFKRHQNGNISNKFNRLFHNRKFSLEVAKCNLQKMPNNRYKVHEEVKQMINKLQQRANSVGNETLFR